MVAKPLAIVMGRNYTSRLGMIRAAGMAGCDVIVIQTEHEKSKLGTIDDKSKYVIGCKYSPEPNKKGLIDTIKSCARKDMKPVLLPTDDYTAATIDAYLDILKKDFYLPNINNEQGAIIRLMDKSLQKKLAAEAGMNVAKEWICNWQNGSYQIPDDIVYPCFTKPQLSSQGHLKSYQKRCNTPTELERVLVSIGKFFHGPILIEEYQEIDKEYAVVGLSLKDSSIMPSVIKMEHSWHGITAIGKLFPFSEIPSLEVQLSDFLRRTQLIGLFDIDFYESNGKMFFNELNVRFGANGFALSYSYLNLPGIFICYLLGNKNLSGENLGNSDSLIFANENILRQMYLEGILSLKDYKKFCRSANINAIKHQEDLAPYYAFKRADFILPLWKLFKKAKECVRANS